VIRAGDVIILGALSLLCIGVVMVNSAGMTVGDGGAPVTLWSMALSRPALFMALATGAMLVASRAPVRAVLARRRVGAFVPWILPAIVALCLLVYAPMIGREVNGARRWVDIPFPGVGSVNFQPSEIAKWGLPVVLAWHLVRHGERNRLFFGGALPAVLAIGAVAGLIALEDLGTGVLIGAVGALMLVAGGVRLSHLLVFAPGAAAGLSLVVLIEPYRVMRLVTFLNPYADPEGAGYHMIQSMAAVAGGDVFGRGLGFGLQKFGYLPEDRNDFLFAVICEELGVAGAAVIVALYLAILWAGWSIVRREQAPAARLLGLGILATLGMQAVMNMAVVTGLGPTKGIALPLLSAGGTGWIVTAASLGLLVSLSRRPARSGQGAPEWAAQAGAPGLPAGASPVPATRIITRPHRPSPRPTLLARLQRAAFGA
jgi:cell division protein FtsW